MGKIIPFFHYDLLARIIPGAATLAAVFILGGSCVSRPLGFFSPDQWKTLGVPIVLGGLCYLVGVVYETL
ncbi:MAG: hypothetical protein LAP21_17440, partial [Acidobacteriia bacterium]|nr:hypothetical protein [Terriglobia bacterium]